MKKYYLLITFCLLGSTIYPQQTINSDSLNNEPILLDEVIVNAPDKNIGSRGLGNMRLNVRQLQVSPLFFGERDIIKTLQFLPGVSSGMEGSSQLNIRGGTNDQTLYLMDGVPVYNQNHTFGLFSIFNADAIRSVDLYKGGIPSPFGDRLSGVVSVEVKDGDSERYKHTVSLGFLAGTIATEGPIVKDRLSYLIVGRRSFVDLLYNGYKILSHENDGGNAMISFYDLNGKVTWKINPENKISLQFFSGYDDLYGMNIENDALLKEKYKEKYGYGWKTFTTSLHYNSDINKNVKLSSNIYYTDLENFNYSKNYLKKSDLTTSSENGKSSLLNEIGGKINITHNFNDNNTVLYGLEGAYQVYTPNYVFRTTNNNMIVYNFNKLTLLKLSGFIYDEFKYKNWLLGLGIRASLYNNKTANKVKLEPRIKVNTFVNEKNKLMFAYDYMSQPVHTINEMDYNSKSDYWIPFHGDILPYSNQISVGWKNYTFSSLSFSLEAYYKTMRNLLQIKDIEYYLDYNTDFALGKGVSKGLEFMTEYSKNRFTAWASYTLSSTNRTFDNKTYPFKYDSPHDVSSFFSYVISNKHNTKQTLSTQVQFKTGYPYTIPEITFPGMGLPSLPSGFGEITNYNTVDYFPSNPNTRLKNYFRMDLNYTIEKKYKTGYLTWQFSILNATNNKNPYIIYKKDGKYKAFVLIPIMPSISVKREF